ncbi:hypothetical protein [Rubrivirga marina]|uniref:Uncharacterized protein n=1 Tax=Rubrivirga marina TaxID=1196024 RepID=A0A271IXH8_9BACT|nr:hypothetical protein [Rubrivirga marina]PAP75946.1 hypothetical protein BSZ37_05575 [Rubrivirga marina]
MSLAPASLRRTFADLVGDQPSRLATDAFVEHSRQIATAYLLRRTHSGRLRLDQFDLRVEDLALDCFADLFRRDDEGRLVRLRGYAQSIGWESLDDAGLAIAVRRLVFSVVNEGLFRRYRESDPTVGRLIRTLKQHVGEHDRLSLHRVRGTYLVELLDATPDQKARPLMPPEVLEAHLHGLLGSSGPMRDVVGELAELFASHPLYAPAVSLPDLALCIRNVLARRGEISGEATADADDVDGRNLTVLVQSYIEHALARVRHDMEGLYVGRRGISPNLYLAYFRAVGDILRDQLTGAGTPDLSFREALNGHIAAVSSKEYRRTHQAVLEYLVNLTRARVLAQAAPLV